MFKKQNTFYLIKIHTNYLFFHSLLMGQKIHPLGFRLGVSQKHHSNWFSPFNHYSELIQEDSNIRQCIQQYVRKFVRSSFNYGGIVRVDIQRKTDLVQVEIHTAFPALLIESRGQNRSSNTNEKGLEILKQKLENILTSEKRKLRIILSEVKKPYASAIVLAEYIALQLESRVAFRKTMKKAIELANKEYDEVKGIKVQKVKGIKIQIAGRLNGAEIARVEWAREGRVPLHTLRAHIDYCHYGAHTIYGVLGIKVWVCLNQ